ncbi:MAG: hypothetical protein RLZZ293_306 [Pseudomonadota bacterium]|jgi:hypothetical protein
MTLNLSDPRRYSKIYPEGNLLINQALEDLKLKNDNQLMVALISDLLKQQQDQLLSVAYNLSPNQDCANYIWQSLHRALNPIEITMKSQLLALPVVIVIGSKQQIQLNPVIDLSILQQLFSASNFAQLSFSPQLFSPEQIAKFTPSQLWNWSNQAQLENQQLPWNNLTSLPIINLGEGVHLRFILGSCLVTQEEGLSILSSYFEQISLQLMQQLNQSLATDNATIFSLPFAPCALSLALVTGECYRQEIAISVALSNNIRQLRLMGKNPYLKLSSQKNNIQIELWENSGDKAIEILLWHLHPSDDFKRICEILAKLFADMQLTRIEYYFEHEHNYEN